MGVMTDHQIGAGLHGRPGNGYLVGRGLAGVLGAGVQQDDHHVGLLPRRPHIRLHRRWPGPGDALRGRHVNRTVPAGRCIAQDRHPHSAQRVQGWPPGVLSFPAHAHNAQPQHVQGVQCLVQARQAIIQGVVVGQRQQVQAALDQCLAPRGMGADQVALVQRPPLGGQHAFQIGRSEVGRPE